MFMFVDFSWGEYQYLYSEKNARSAISISISLLSYFLGMSRPRKLIGDRRVKVDNWRLDN